MGCSSSSLSDSDGTELQARRPQISGPVEPPTKVPRTKRGTGGVPLPVTEFELSEQNIQRALSYVAEHLVSRSKNLVIVAVGGAVNTILLHTRRTTHDVDFFHKRLTGSELSLLRDACTYAEERSSVPLGDEWLNNATGTIGGTMEFVPQLVEEAINQRDIVFRAPGLTVFAAPWYYAFIAKVGRLSYGTGRTYDADDAVAYLHQHISKHGGRPVPLKTIKQWGTMFKRAVSEDVLRDIDQRYQRRHGSHGIGFG